MCGVHKRIGNIQTTNQDICLTRAPALNQIFFSMCQVRAYEATIFLCGPNGQISSFHWLNLSTQTYVLNTLRNAPVLEHENVCLGL